MWLTDFNSRLSSRPWVHTWHHWILVWQMKHVLSGLKTWRLSPLVYISCGDLSEWRALICMYLQLNHRSEPPYMCFSCSTLQCLRWEAPRTGPDGSDCLPYPALSWRYPQRYGYIFPTSHSKWSMLFHDNSGINHFFSQCQEIWRKRQ